MRLSSIINPGRFGSKGYASVVIGNCEVTFLRGRKDAAFYPFFFYVLVIYGIAVSEV